MRQFLIALILCAAAVAQTTQTPQSPRQALIEMIKSPTPDQVDRHLPTVMVKGLAKLPPEAQKIRQQQTMLVGMGLAMMGVQTYDSGPILAVIQNPKDGTKVEITVERDELTGDIDAMEFGLRFYKDGKAQDLPVPFRIQAAMRMEDGVWRLVRIGGSVSLALDDPKLVDEMVKRIQEEMQKQKSLQPMNGRPANIPPDMRVIGSLKTLAAAEGTYASSYPQVGYTCRLSDLGGTLNGNEANEHAAHLIDPALAGGRKNGYKFEVTGCGTAPANSFQIVARPLQTNVGWAAYCADQTGVVRSIAEANAAYCIEAGSPDHSK